jgi:hypothetical protein
MLSGRCASNVDVSPESSCSNERNCRTGIVSLSKNGAKRCMKYVHAGCVDSSMHFEPFRCFQDSNGRTHNGSNLSSYVHGICGSRWVSVVKGVLGRPHSTWYPCSDGYILGLLSSGAATTMACNEKLLHLFPKAPRIATPIVHTYVLRYRKYSYRVGGKMHVLQCTRRRDQISRRSSKANKVVIHWIPPSDQAAML